MRYCSKACQKNDWKRHKCECSRVAAGVNRRSKNEVYYGFMDEATYWRWQKVMEENYKWEELDPEKHEHLTREHDRASSSSGPFEADVS